MGKENKTSEQQLREQRAEAERNGDTARVAEIDRQLNESTGPQR